MSDGWLRNCCFVDHSAALSALILARRSLLAEDRRLSTLLAFSGGLE